jgi:hypothetical protein
MADNRYKDIDFSFKAHPITGDLIKKVDREAVKQSVKNLVLTNFNESLMNPRKGSDTTSQLFENNTPIVKIQLKTNIRQVIDNYEPRADVIDVNVNETSDGHGLIVDILFNVVNDPEPVSVQVVLRRTR